MRATAIIGLLGDEVLDFLSATTHTDYKVHKLKGAVLFKLLVYSLLTQREASLRVLEGVFNSYSFQRTAGLPGDTKTRFNSIRDRIATIDPLYFKTLFDHVVATYSKLLTEEQPRLVRFDSTMVAVSAQLLHLGIHAGEKTDKRQVKFTIGFDGLLPCSAKAYTHRRYTSENQALAEAIRAASLSRHDIAVFDRGLQNRHTLCDMNAAGVCFVTRLKTDARLEVLTSTKVGRQTTAPPATVRIHKDCQVHLFDRHGKVLQPFRLIQATIRNTRQPIWFLTNIRELDAYQIAAIYKKRWDIEVFFKFIKQELHVKHILVRTAGAIESMLYVTLIAAILLLVYKKLNDQKGYKLVRMHFAQELEEDLIEHIVLLCGGDPAKMYHAP